MILTRETDVPAGAEAVLCNLLNPESCGHAVSKCHTVINLIGLIRETETRNFRTSHVDIPAILARVASEAGVKQFIHVSALGASQNSISIYKITKAEGEAAVRAHFPSAVIVRPSVVMGAGNKFFSTVALLARFSPVLPVPRPSFKLRPVHIEDLCECIGNVVEKGIEGTVIEVCGPDVMTNAELFKFALKVCGLRRLLIPVPLFVAELGAALISRIFPEVTFSRDSVRALREGDNVCADNSTFVQVLGHEPRAVSLKDVKRACGN